MIQVPPMILTQMISKPEVHPITLKASLMIEAHPVILYAQWALPTLMISKPEVQPIICQSSPMISHAQAGP